MAQKRSQITQPPTRSRLATSTTSSWRERRKPHPAKPGPEFPRLSPKRLSLPSCTGTKVPVTPSFPSASGQELPRIATARRPSRVRNSGINSLRPTFSGSPLFIPFRPTAQALDRRLRSPWPRAQHSPIRQKNMQEQFFFYASVPVNDKRRERFEPFFRSGTRDDINGPGYYANIFDTV